uniref:Uncharacterized protein n=1 Tax=Sus scrofa TaxID=9823 RepID=A0A8D1T172_PIG
MGTSILFGLKTADNVLYTSYIQPQLRTLLVQNVTGPGPETKRDHSDMSEVGLKVVEVLRMAKNVLDPLRQVLDRRHAVQPIAPASLASELSLFLFLWPPWGDKLPGPLPHLPSFVLQPVHLLLPPLRSRGTEVSQKRNRGQERESIFSWGSDLDHATYYVVLGNCLIQSLQNEAKDIYPMYKNDYN